MDEQEQNFEFLKNVISSKRITDNLLEQQILDTENSFVMFESNSLKKNIEKNTNIENNLKNENNDNNEQDKKIEENYGNIINISNNESSNYKANHLDNNDRIIINLINKNNKSNAMINKNENIINNNDYKTNNKKKKINIRTINSSGLDLMKIENNKNNKDNNKKILYDKSIKNSINKKIHKAHNKSMDYDRNKYYLNNYNNSINNRFNFYQTLFKIKLKKEKMRINNEKEKFKFNSNDNFHASPRNLKKSIYSQEIYSDDEVIIKNKKDKPHKNNNNIINYKSDSNLKKQNQNAKENLKIETLSFKSKDSSIGRKYKSNNFNEKFLKTYERFKENQQKKKERIESLKKIQNDKEKKICLFKPKINKKSKKIKDDFYTRQKKKIEEQKKKNELLKLKLKQYEEEKINKNNVLLKNKSSKNKSKKNISKSINKLYEWDSNRKQKISEKRKKRDELIKKENYDRPKINKKSKQLAEINLKKNYNEMYNKLKKNDNDNIFERLYKYDVIKRKEKQKVLNEVYSFSFSPKISKHIRKSNNNEYAEYEMDESYIGKNLNINNNYENDSITFNSNDLYSESVRNCLSDDEFTKLLKSKILKNYNNKYNNEIRLVKISENNEENSKIIKDNKKINETIYKDLNKSGNEENQMENNSIFNYSAKDKNDTEKKKYNSLVIDI